MGEPGRLAKGEKDLLRSKLYKMLWKSTSACPERKQHIEEEQSIQMEEEQGNVKKVKIKIFYWKQRQSGIKISKCWCTIPEECNKHLRSKFKRN